MKKKWNKDLYCQFLLASQRKFTATQASDLTSVTHDTLLGWLTSVKLTPNILWEHVEGLVEKRGGVLVVDDSVIVKQYSRSHIFCAILSCLALEKKRLEENITWYGSKRRIIADALFPYLKQPMIPLPKKQ